MSAVLLAEEEDLETCRLGAAGAAAGSQHFEFMSSGRFFNLCNRFWLHSQRLLKRCLDRWVNFRRRGRLLHDMLGGPPLANTSAFHRR